ncbi:hypothetical protein JR316_0001627 [Psilocybe cubensis]|uniref:Uncharacterized protein n=2 Tax=Psilocybe cubensis TaxID=181762 RepID=A0ACB8HAM1_PSICU|nr:hypothetical protein JR316_0001627 [Psilocybe cubensis]KAH9484727.1 hypothetical protein JR316_0001627 [Psilocybe cubensis]
MARQRASKAIKTVNREMYLRRRRAYYEANCKRERRKSQERYQRRKSLPDNELALSRQKHREAQARYRERNRFTLKVKAKIYYRKKQNPPKEEEEDPDEEEEWIRLSALAHGITEEEWISLHGRNSYRGGSPVH